MAKRDMSLDLDPKRMSADTDMVKNLADAEWVKQSFFIPGNFIFGRGTKAEQKKKWNASRGVTPVGRRFSSAELKFTDTTPGGNYSMNPKPQFTRWADPKMPGIARNSKGMGEYYSEAIDDNAQRIHMQFGVPEYNSLTNFFARFFDSELAHAVNTGETEGFLFYFGKASGYLLTLPFQIIMGAASVMTRLWSFANGTPYSKFYYLKATMPLYWSTVSVLVNKIGVNMGIIYGPQDEATVSPPERMKQADTKYIDPSGAGVATTYKILPDVMTSNGGIDIYAMASRAQRLSVAHTKALSELGKGMSPEEYGEAIKNYITEKISSPEPKFDNIAPYLNEFWNKLTAAKVSAAREYITPDVMDNATPKDVAEAQFKKRVEVARLYETDDGEKLLTGMLEDGLAFASFTVDYEGATGESFSNSTQTSAIAEKINSMSSTAREMRFNFAGGNFMDNPIANMIESASAAVMDVVRGGLSSVGLSGLSSLAGAGYASIPDIWSNSSANLPRNNYTIKLSTPYGNKLSILINIYIPLCMLLAAALPRATGKSSYGPPFLCRLWSKGRSTVQLGIIDSLSIERGTGGVGWSVDGFPTSVDVSFSVISLDKDISVPISELGGPAAEIVSMFEEDTPLTNYLSALGSLDLYSQYYFKPRLSLSWRNSKANIESWMSKYHWAARFVGSAPGRLISMVYRGSNR